MRKVICGHHTYYVDHSVSPATIWEESSAFGPHTNIRFQDGLCLGNILTNPDKSLYDHLPVGSPERIAGVSEAYRRLRVMAEAIRAIAFWD